LDTDNWIDCYSELEYQNNTENDLNADDEFHIDKENGIINLECRKQRIGSTETNVPGLFRPVLTSKIYAQTVLTTVNGMGVRRNQGNNKLLDTLHRCVSAGSLCYLTENLILRLIMGE